MSRFALNLKILRKQEGISQTQFAEAIGLNRPVIGAYEEGRAEPKSEVLVTMANYFNVSVEDLIKSDLSKARQKKISGKDLRILPFAVDAKSNRELVPLVPLKAAAGYLNGFADPEFISELPVFDLPFAELLREKSYRLFQVSGESMLPVPHNAYIIGSYVQDWNSVKNNQCYLFVTSSEGIVYKRAQNKLNTNESFILHSDNQLYESFEVSVNDVREIWKAHGFVSFELPEKK